MYPTTTWRNIMNISTLEHFIEEQNNWAKIFNENSRGLCLLRAEDRQTIAEMIECALSPENLTCDGELSHNEVEKQYKYLTRCAQELLSIDPTVNFYEYS